MEGVASVCGQFLGANLSLTPSTTSLTLFFHDGGHTIKGGMGEVHSMNWARKNFVRQI